jgi:hypothetical protein
LTFSTFFQIIPKGKADFSSSGFLGKPERVPRSQIMSLETDIRMDSPLKLCTRCQKPVTICYDDYELFEGMHWLCFHLEFEHAADPDEPCSDPSCPWWHIEVYRKKLRELDEDPDKVLEEAIAKLVSE